MSPKNVETVRAAHESWNRRDFPGVIRDSAEGLVYTDHGRSLTLKTRDRFREWTEGWRRPSRMEKSLIPNTLMAETLWSHSSHSKAQTTAHWGRSRLPTSDIPAVLRGLSTRRTRTRRVGGLLLRSIHTFNSARAHPTARRGSLSYLRNTNLPSQKARRERAFCS